MAIRAKNFTGSAVENSGAAAQNATTNLDQWLQGEKIDDFSVESQVFTKEERRVTTVVCSIIVKYDDGL